MHKGVVFCDCEQLFSFETMLEIVRCPKCKKEYIAVDCGTGIEEEVIDDGIGDAEVVKDDATAI